MMAGNLTCNSALAESGKQGVQAANATEETAIPQPTSTAGKIGYGIAGGIANSIPEIMALGLNPVVALAGFGDSSVLEEAGQVQARGVMPSQASLAGGAAAAI